MVNREEIGKKISANRKTLGLTQKQVSEITGINKTTISEIENGRFTGSFDIFECLIGAVGLQFEITDKKHSLPDWDEIEDLEFDGINELEIHKEGDVITLRPARPDWLSFGDCDKADADFMIDREDVVTDKGRFNFE